MATATQPVASAVTEEVKQAAPPTATTTEETQVATPGQETAVEQPTEVVEQEEQELNLDEAPESTGDFAKYKEMFKQAPELRQILGQHKAMTELRGDQPFSEFRAIHELIPTLQDAEEMSNLANQHRQMGQLLRESPADFLESLRESDSNAYTKLVQSLPQVLAEEDRELYSSHARYYVSEVMDNLYRAGQGNQEFLTALGTVAQALGINMGMPNATRPANTEAEKLRQQLKQREEADREKAFSNFHASAEGNFKDAMITEIEASIRKSVSNANESTLRILVPRVWTALNNTMERQPQLVAQVEEILDGARKGRISDAEFRRLTSLLINRGKSTLPNVLKNELREWTAAVVSSNNSKTEKQKQIAAASRDAGTGASASGSAANNSPQKKMTREELWKSLDAKVHA